MTTRTITFNTGRHYAADGQRIDVTANINNYGEGPFGDGVVIFNDRSRGIDGAFEARQLSSMSDASLRELVMWHYDHNQYTSPYQFEQRALAYAALERERAARAEERVLGTSADEPGLDIEEVVYEWFQAETPASAIIEAVRGLTDNIHRDPAVHNDVVNERLCSELYNDLTKALETAKRLERSLDEQEQ